MLGWPWFKRKGSAAQRATDQTNGMLEGIGGALDRFSDMWQLIDHGPYANKRVLARAIRYIAHFDSDEVPATMILRGEVLLDSEVVTNPHIRLDPGTHIVYLKGIGSYRFTI